ncbi:hypothetical protein [Staphylococcus gallinarum]|uniref:hypothetical protein n=1 Tax=Staphylococcus gallinarum TaxID=1293 RepID=UPI003F56025A
MNEVFNIKCKTGHYRTDPFTFSNMMDTDRTYYYLNGDIGNFRVNRVNDNYDSSFISRFNDIEKTEKFYLEKINVIYTFENNGIMTIMFCDMILSILKREMAYYNNIELKLVNLAGKCRNEKIVNVYRSVLPEYELSDVESKSSRMILEKLQYVNNLGLNFYSDIYYLFPLKTRKKDIEYYENLRDKKMKNLNVQHIKEIQRLSK